MDSMIRALTTDEIDFVAGAMYCPTTTPAATTPTYSVGSGNYVTQTNYASGEYSLAAANQAGAAGNFLVGGNIINVTVSSSSKHNRN